MGAQNDQYKSSRVFAIIVAALEYFIAILVGSTYLAKLAGSMGLDDGMIGVVSSFLSLGCGFQIVAIFFPSTIRTKRLVIATSLANQICFTLLYVLPVFKLSSEIRTGIFIALLLVANILINVAFSPRTVWIRSLVDDDKRGRFAAANEITSLISGMIFTMAMGVIIDTLEASGRLDIAFIICGVTIAILTILDTVLLFLIKEKPIEKAPDEAALKRVCHALTDKTTLTLLPLYVIWNIAIYTTTPFFGTYQLDDLGFTMTFVSVLSVAYAIVRSLASRPIGSFGDRHSFAKSISIGYIAIILGFAALVFFGKVGYIIYYMLYAVTLAATNSGQVNIIYDYVAPEKRSGAVAILYTVGGFSGFFATLAIRPLVNHIQSNGNSFLGIENVYAQQVLAVFGAFCVLLCLLYVNLVIRRMPMVRSLGKENAAVGSTEGTDAK